MTANDERKRKNYCVRSNKVSHHRYEDDDVDDYDYEDEEPVPQNGQSKGRKPVAQVLKLAM